MKLKNFIKENEQEKYARCRFFPQNRIKAGANKVFFS